MVDMDGINCSIIVVDGAFSLVDIGKGIADFGSLLQMNLLSARSIR